MACCFACATSDNLRRRRYAVIEAIVVGASGGGTKDDAVHDSMHDTKRLFDGDADYEMFLLCT